MGNDKRIFKNLVFACTAQQVGGISKGLAIKGKGMLVVTINNGNGKPHRIKIPNSLYLPGLRMCLLSPQHWAQEARDNYPRPNSTRIENDAHSCKLFWCQGCFIKMIPFDNATNTQIFYTLPLTTGYRAFVHTFQALEAPFFQREHVLQLPGCRWLDCDAPAPPEEFMAEEDINYKKMMGNEGVVQANNDTVVAGNLPPPPDEAPHPDAVHCHVLTFDPSLPLAKEDKYSLSAPADQAELMRWHYRLGHEPFSRLKVLALNGEIPMHLTHVHPPQCAGCHFGAMTKVPWCTKGHHNKDHPIFAATKPGECISVDHMQSTKPGFYGQAKGALTKTRFRNATIFINHYSHLKFIYLMTTNLTSNKTVDAKQAFKQFAAEHGVQIKHYHCNNGRFVDTLFHAACNSQNQKLTICGVNAHFQNGIAKRAIQDLSERA